VFVNECVFVGLLLDRQVLEPLGNGESFELFGLIVLEGYWGDDLLG
jgi:hypothetical protein